MLDIDGDINCIIAQNDMLIGTKKFLKNLEDKKIGSVEIQNFKNFHIIKIIKHKDILDNELLAEEFFLTNYQDNFLANGGNISFEITEIKPIDDVNPPPIAAGSGDLDVPDIEIPKIVLDDITNNVDWLLKLEQKGKERGEATEYKAKPSIGTLLSMIIFEKYDSWGFKIIDSSLTQYLIKNLNKTIYYVNAEECFNDIAEAAKTGLRTMGIKFFLPNHANSLIIKLDTYEIIHFEPHGEYYMGSSKKTDLEKINKFLNKFVRKFNKWIKTQAKEKWAKSKKQQFKLITSKDITPTPKKTIYSKKDPTYAYLSPTGKKRGFQGIESIFDWLRPREAEPDKKDKKAYSEWKERQKIIDDGEGGGFCMLWSIFFLELILRNPDGNVKELYQEAYDILEEEPERFKNIIRGYFYDLKDKLNELKYKYGVNTEEHGENFYIYINKLTQERKKRRRINAISKGTYNPEYFLGSGKKRGKFNYPNINPQVKKLFGGALKVSEVKGFIDQSYNKKSADTLGDWVLDKQLSTTRAKVYHNTKTGQTTITHTGTDSLTDWGNNLVFGIFGKKGYKYTSRYKDAKKVQDAVEKKYGTKNLSTLGHSQGGLLAEMLGNNSREKITLNKATRIGSNEKSANQFDIRTNRDVVSKLNPLQKKTERDITIKSQSYNPLTEHSPDVLNQLDQDQIIGQGKGKKNKWDIHSVVLKKVAYNLPEAKKTSQKIIKDKRKVAFKDDPKSYSFQNIPKQKFSNFRTKKVNENVNIVFGKLKEMAYK